MKGRSGTYGTWEIRRSLRRCACSGLTRDTGLNHTHDIQLISPAPRLSVVSALVHPDDFVRAHSQLTVEQPREEPTGADVDLDVALRDLEGDLEEGRAPALWQLPDASILFRRYADAGRMVNVFDWFQSFAVVLESQRRHLRGHERDAGEPTVNGKSPRRNGAGPQAAAQKGKQRRNGAVDGDGDGTSDHEDNEDDEDSEGWREEVQARFIRALHTLDHMGLVRHTGRKADHIIRTVYDVLD